MNEMLSTVEIAKRESVDKTTVLYWIRTGKIKATKLGRDWVISGDDYKEFKKTRNK